MNLEFYIKKLNDLFANQEIDEESLDYTQFDTHIAFLKQLAIVENSSMSVFDLHKKKYVFAQSKFLSLLGVELEKMMEKGPQMFYSIMHPSDVSFIIDTYYLFVDFIKKVSADERKSFKLICDFRLKDKTGKYFRFIYQMLPLELDKKGNIWLMLITYDLISGNVDSFKSQRKIINVKTNELYFFPKDSRDGQKNSLTKREVEILGLLAKGMASKKIADELFLSVNTVNNHRRNILEKTKSENTAMAIQYGISLGLL
jgi:DNA-binding CsgD family transcriptional regulator